MGAVRGLPACARVPGDLVEQSADSWEVSIIMAGRRTLLIAVNVLVEFLKEHNNVRRSFTVEDALPDDARVVEVRTRAADRLVGVVLESASWEWDDDNVLSPPPRVVVKFEEMSV
jgi:hypothetical protein